MTKAEMLAEILDGDWEEAYYVTVRNTVWNVSKNREARAKVWADIGQEILGRESRGEIKKIGDQPAD